jgi:hypothetical protein
MIIEPAPGEPFTVPMRTMTGLNGRAIFSTTSQRDSRGWIYMVLTEAQADLYNTEGVTVVGPGGVIMNVQVVIRGQFTVDDIIREGNYFSVTARPGTVLNYTVYNEPRTTPRLDAYGRFTVPNNYGMVGEAGYVLNLSKWCFEDEEWQPLDSILFENTAESVVFSVPRDEYLREGSFFNFFRIVAENQPGEFVFSFSESRTLSLDITRLVTDLGKINIKATNDSGFNTGRLFYTLTELYAPYETVRIELNEQGEASFDRIDITKPYVMRFDSVGYRQEIAGYSVSIDGGAPVFIPAAADAQEIIIDFTQWDIMHSVEITLEPVVRRGTFNLDFTKLNASDNSPVAGLTYVLNNLSTYPIMYTLQTMIRVTDANGFVSFENLLIDETYILYEMELTNNRRIHRQFIVTFGDFNGELAALIHHPAGMGGLIHHRSDMYPSEYSDWVILEPPNRNGTGTIRITVYNADDPEEKLDGTSFNFTTFNPFVSSDVNQVPMHVRADNNGELVITGVPVGMQSRFRIENTDDRFANMHIVSINGTAQRNPIPLNSHVFNISREGIRAGDNFSMTLEISAPVVVGSAWFFNRDNSGNTMFGPEFALYSGGLTPADEIMRVSVNHNGIVTFPDLRAGEYYLRQVSTVSGFIPDDTVYRVAINGEREFAITPVSGQGNITGSFTAGYNYVNNAR